MLFDGAPVVFGVVGVGPLEVPVPAGSAVDELSTPTLEGTPLGVVSVGCAVLVLASCADESPLSFPHATSKAVATSGLQRGEMASRLVWRFISGI